jgi:hypothetical protein
MGIVGDVPERGLRVTVERERSAGPPWVYRGEAVTPTLRHAITASISESGEVAIELPADSPPGLDKRVRLVLRAAWKHAIADGSPPPLRIARWRASE